MTHHIVWQTTGELSLQCMLSSCKRCKLNSLHLGQLPDNEPASASIAIMTEPSQVSVSLLISNPSCCRSSDSNSTLLCKCFYVDQVMPIHNLARWLFEVRSYNPIFPKYLPKHWPQVPVNNKRTKLFYTNSEPVPVIQHSVLPSLGVSSIDASIMGFISGLDIFHKLLPFGVKGTIQARRRQPPRVYWVY